jgi:predicted amidophosphoribosyltransferase
MTVNINYGICSECGESLDKRKKCHNCLENEYLNEQYEVCKDD